MSETTVDDGDPPDARIVRTEDVLGGQPRIVGRRIGVLDIHEKIVGRGEAPETLATRLDLDLADVYRALTYYYDNPREMELARRKREAAVEEAQARIDRPDDVAPDS
jgi:uncharacterized protein (DUF433 family)